MGRINDPSQSENELFPSVLSTNVPVLPGDYNLDRAVDAADYVLWRATLGNTATAFSGADGNGDGVIDQPDHQVWRSNFGATLPPATPPVAAAARVEPVTEPAGALAGAATGALALDSEPAPATRKGAVASSPLVRPICVGAAVARRGDC
jgi:hypothetical protein